MNLAVLEEARLKSIERILVEKGNQIDAKKDKTLLDYALLLETVVEYRNIQDQIFALQNKRATYTEQELERLITEYKQHENMPCKDLFFNRGDLS